MGSRASSDVQAPLYCARCRRAGEPAERLCYECGDALRPQGFCTICEGWVFGQPGTACPKHEVELLERPDEPGFDPWTSRLVTIASFGVPSEALGPKLRLEAEGIPVFLDGERMGAIYQVATGGVKLQVPEVFIDEARVLLGQSWTPAKGEEPDPDDPWEGLGPEPAELRRSTMKFMILVFLFGPLVSAILGVLLMMLARGRF